MTVNKYLMPIIAIAALIAVVLGARLTGDWIVSGKQIPLGDMTAADIKGWMTLQNVSDGLTNPAAGSIQAGRHPRRRGRPADHRHEGS